MERGEENRERGGWRGLLYRRASSGIGGEDRKQRDSREPVVEGELARVR